MKKHFSHVLLMLAVGLFIACACGAQEEAKEDQPVSASFVVTTLLDAVDEADDVTSLREAVEKAETGNTITFDNSLSGGTIKLNGNPLGIDCGITIDASSIGGITIDGDGQSEVFDVGGGDETSPVKLIGLTITGGKEGGIFSNGTLSIINSTITKNNGARSGYGGGGIFNHSGTISVVDSTISENTSEGDGGGIYNFEGVMTITNSTVSGNNSNTSGTGVGGGGIFNIHATLMITGSTISGNNSKSFGGGGGINNWNNFFTGSKSTVTIIDSKITGNTAAGSGGSGGGISNGDTMTINGSTISGNTASSGGGILNSGALTVARTAISENTATIGAGIFNYNNGALTVTDSVISGNTATPTGFLANYYCGCGGGIYHSGSALTITGATISGNVASGEGRGITGVPGSAGGGVSLYGSSSYSSNAGVSITNSIITFNSAKNGSDFYDPNGTKISGTNSIIGSDPGFVVAPVFDESGTLTNPDVLNLSLAEGSAAIDAGTNETVPSENDLAGNPRIVNETVDIGAYEYALRLDAPEFLTGTNGYYPSYGANRYRIVWNAVKNAAGYEFAYSLDEGNSWSNLETAGRAAVIRNLKNGTNVACRVRAIGSGAFVNSDWSEIKTFEVKPTCTSGGAVFPPQPFGPPPFPFFPGR